jgi:hypothetical protein
MTIRRFQPLDCHPAGAMPSKQKQFVLVDGVAALTLMAIIESPSYRSRDPCSESAAKTLVQSPGT